MKANDQIPEDEMLLAEAIAAAKERGVRWTRGRLFEGEDDDGGRVPPRELHACCALGALILAGHADDIPSEFEQAATIGNDNDGPWFADGQCDNESGFYSRDPNGESFGWAFRCAMTQDDE